MQSHVILFEPVDAVEFLIAIGLHFYPLHLQQKSITESYFNIAMMYDQNPRAATARNASPPSRALGIAVRAT
jgi:hypothetical protein